MLRSVKQAGRKALAYVVGVFGAVGTAAAAVPASFSTALTNIQTDGLALFDLVIPVVAAVVGVVILIKLFKRGMNKI